MKILLIDNHSKHLCELVAKLSNAEVVDYKKINLKSSDSFDGIILSGGTGLCVEGHAKEFSKELELIKNTKKPVLGICLGFQLICFAFCEDLVKMDYKAHGVTLVKTDNKDIILKSVPKKFNVFESHKWAVKKTKFLKKIASSEDGVEVVKHTKKNIYGVQFHPEVFVDNDYGDKIIKNFLEIVYTKGSKKSLKRQAFSKL